MACVVEIDMDRAENQHPKQHLEEEESIIPEIIAVSELKRYINGRAVIIVVRYRENGKRKLHRFLPTVYPCICAV